MKKLPLVFSGCLLGLAGAGNLVLDTVPVLSHLLSLSGLILLAILSDSSSAQLEANQARIDQAPSFAGMATFPMAGMILSTYVFRVFPHLPLVAQGLWWFHFSWM